MKLIIISIIGFIILLFTVNTFSELKEDHYTILKEIEDIEIRKYKKLIYVSYTPKDATDRDNSFRNVAGYIFGDNKKETKIDMTSPVVIKLHNKSEMAFIMPKQYTLQNLPEAKNKELLIYEEPSNVKASIRYSGYSNYKKEKRYIERLKKILSKYHIAHKDDFELLVYNAPYQFFNRRNEIVVSIEYNNDTIQQSENPNIKTLHLGSGCFWCTEAIFENVIGVTNVVSGFSGGKIKNPSYKEVSKGLTEHAEVCEVTYNQQEILLEDILNIFFLSHDPTTLNKQGNDIGKHYRSIILYNSNKEKKRIQNYILKINKDLFNNKVVTELAQFEVFYKAEEYHQNYYKENNSAPYCQTVISPKIIKAKQELSTYYK